MAHLVSHHCFGREHDLGRGRWRIITSWARNGPGRIASGPGSPTDVLRTKPDPARIVPPLRCSTSVRDCTGLATPSRSPTPTQGVRLCSSLIDSEDDRPRLQACVLSPFAPGQEPDIMGMRSRWKGDIAEGLGS